MNREMSGARSVNIWLRGDLGMEQLLAMPEMEEVRELAGEISVMTEVENWLGVLKEETLPEGYQIQAFKPALNKRPCILLFDLTIHPDGDMQVCSCRNIFSDPDLYIGNIGTMTIAEACTKIPKILERWETGRFPQSCEKCSMYGDPSVGFVGRMGSIVRKRFSVK